MSLHFDVSVACDLKPSTPRQVIDTIHYLVRTEDDAFDDAPDHEFFRQEGWSDVLQQAPEDTYCPGDLFRTFRRAYRFSRQGVDQYRHTLAFRTYMVDDGFYELFYYLIDWLAMHSDTEGFVGYYREELAWWPELIFFKNGAAYLREAKESPRPMRDDAPDW